MSLDSLTCRVRFTCSTELPTSAGRRTVISSSRIELGAPIRAENSRSSMYTTQKMVLQRFESSSPPNSSGTCRCIPSMTHPRSAWPIWFQFLLVVYEAHDCLPVAIEIPFTHNCMAATYVLERRSSHIDGLQIYSPKTKSLDAHQRILVHSGQVRQQSHSSGRILMSRGSPRGILVA